MFRGVVRLAAIVVCFGVCIGGGCSGKPARVHPPAIDAAAAGEAAIQQYDSDGDGLIRGAELTRAPALRSALERLDADQDGAVSAEEIAARVRAWQRTQTGATSLSCTVTYRGRPLEGATVRFVPEEFLGEEIQTATGQTDELGSALLSVPPDPDHPGRILGVACGLYRVEITKEGVDIPARYNTQTVLGQEVADDCQEVRLGIRFDLK